MPEAEIIVKNRRCSGRSCFSRHPVPFQALLDYLKGGQTLDEFFDDFPTVTREAAGG
jgi:uncharacterized protein (DUF433 family)